MTLKLSTVVAVQSNLELNSRESVPILQSEVEICHPGYSYSQIPSSSEARAGPFNNHNIFADDTTLEAGRSVQRGYEFNQRTSNPLDRINFQSLWPGCQKEIRVDRGRVSFRTPRLSNPLERAGSRDRREHATVELEVRSIKPRYYRSNGFHDEFKDQCWTFDDRYLKPCPHDPICQSVSEMIEPQSTGSSIGSSTRSPRRGPWYPNFDIVQSKTADWSGRETVLQENEPQELRNEITSNSIRRSPPHVGDTQCSAPATPPIVSPPTTVSCPIAVNAQFPAEVMYQIYLNLSPVDFNSARHACRSWYINSLERCLLQTMLKRGGWSTGILNELVLNHVLDSQVRVNDEWLMSKRIARECSLGPDWTGSGLCATEGNQQLIFKNSDSKVTPFVPLSTTDFTETGVHYPGLNEPSSGIIFTVSTCGQFLMVAHGCLVYIYELNCGHNDDNKPGVEHDGSLRPVTSIVCPRRVLACSMDTSSRRYAIAILLDGRMGLVSDLESLKDRTRRSAAIKYKSLQDTAVNRGNQFRNRVSISSSRLRTPLRAQIEQPFVFPVIAAEHSQSKLPTDLEIDSWQDVTQSEVSHDKKRDDGFSPIATPTKEGNTQETFGIPSYLYSMQIETSTPTIYAPLCSADDPPRSVALCPQRRCVAFGCSSGIELHWVDALTGQDLSRWFPLTAPSDFLYFLPPRAGVDSAKKLRLISSAGQPSERSVLAEKFGGNRIVSHNGLFWATSQSRCSDGWEGLPAIDHSVASVLRRDMSDHYRAVPISDGYHILFTDPATEILCLGSDAPVGSPTKLIRKIWFTGPQGQGSAVAYTAASDLRWGVRVVAAYGHGPQQNIWLFSIPVDVFKEIQAQQDVRDLSFTGTSSGAESGNQDWVKWWCNASAQDYLEPASEETYALIAKRGRLWPLQVRGQEIGRCDGLVDLTIDGGAAMIIWAFSMEGLAHTWKIDNGRADGTEYKRFTVLRDGTVREIDVDGDVQMLDASSPLSLSSQSLAQTHHDTFDGPASLANSQVLATQDIWHCHDNGSSKDSVNYDADGDVLMAGLSDRERATSDDWLDKNFETAVQAHGHEDLLRRSKNGSFVEEWGMSGRDVVDVLTGIARMDVEIY